MKLAGQITLLLGLLICGYAAFAQGVSVPGGYGERDIINIGLQQDRLLTFAFGLTAIVVGAVFQVGGEVIDRMSNRSPAIATDLAAEHRAAPTGPPRNIARGPEEIAEEMATLGVVAQGDKYVFGSYRYDRLVDALAYARSRRP